MTVSKSEHQRVRIKDLPAAAALRMQSKFAITDLLTTSPVDCWRAWIREICQDPDMDLERVVKHIQAHVGNHIPEDGAPVSRWQEWLAGTYNLLAILECSLGCKPSHTQGADLLFRKWKSKPDDHTPPPKKHVKKTKQAVRSAGYCPTCNCGPCMCGSSGS